MRRIRGLSWLPLLIPVVAFAQIPGTVPTAPSLALPGVVTPLSELRSLAHLQSLSRLRVLAPHATIQGADLADLADLAQAAVATQASRIQTVPPQPLEQQDPADSLYRAARAALNRSNYARAAELFRRIHETYPRSAYAPDAYYWEAFALYRSGGNEDLRSASRALHAQAAKHPNARTRPDADVLLARINGELARQGDTDAAEWVAAQAGSVAAPPAAPVAPAAPAPVAGPASPKPSTPKGRRTQTTDCPDENDDMRVAALNALLQMDADRAAPILKKVLARRDPCSEILRRKAVFLVSQHETPETEGILLAAARSDPDPEVRQQAVFWLSQVDSERAVSALDSILRESDDPEIKEKAVFALSQMDSPRAHQIIRGYAERADAPERVREQAIFWLGQKETPENARFLRGLYGRLRNDELKKKVVFSLAQMGGEENLKWILDIALDSRESMENRKNAIFWAGEGGIPISQLTGLYDRMADREMKEQLIFVYSQRDEETATDKLLQIAKTEPDRELRKKALFWLSQSDDPRAAQVLMEILEKE